MTIRKKKVSELQEASTYEGLIVLGIDSTNTSVKAPMSVLKGNKGDAATVAISATTLQGAPGSAPVVVNEGTSAAAILKFTLPSGQNVEFQKSSTHIQWRVVGTVNWANLVPLTDIKGDKGDDVSMQMSATHVQYQVGSAGWINLISIAALQQPAVDAILAANAAAANASDKAALADSKATLANTKAGLADTAASNADAKAISAYTVQLRLEALEQSLIAEYKAMPTSMVLSYPQRITNRNMAIQKITSTLAPTGTGSNVLFLGDNVALTVFPDGGFVINRAGQSRVHCIPTENTAIYQTITIDVVEPVMRKVAAASLRFLANGNLRLT